MRKNEILLPLALLTQESLLALVSVQKNVARYTNGIKGESTDTKIEFVNLDTFQTYTVKPKNVPDMVKNITEEEILEANRRRDWFIIGFNNCTARPYANSNGYGINYSLSADDVRLVHDPRKNSNSAKDSENADSAEEFIFDEYEDEEAEQ